MLVPIVAVVCVAVSVLVARKLAFFRRRSPARAAASGPSEVAAQARAAPSNSAHQKDSVADAHPDPTPPETLDESWDEDETALMADDVEDEDDLEMPSVSRDRSTDSSVITCLRIDPREVLSEEPIESRPLAAAHAPPPPPRGAQSSPHQAQPQKLPSILDMMKSSSTAKQSSAKPAAKPSASKSAAKPAAANPSPAVNATVNVPRPAGAASLQALPRTRAPRATPQAQPATSAPASASTASSEPQMSTKPAPLPRLPR